MHHKPFGGRHAGGGELTAPPSNHLAELRGCPAPQEGEERREELGEERMEGGECNV